MRAEKTKFIFFTKDTRLYRSFFPLLIVITLQQLASLTVNMVDNVMLGSYTELALSGATLVNQIQYTLQQLAAGTGVGIVVLASQYWGKKETEPIKSIISLGLKASLLMGIVFFIVSFFMPYQLLGLLTNDSLIVEEGVKYLKIICFTYIIFAVSNSLMYSLQSVETAFIGTVMSVSTIIINMCLNYCLIFGNFGFPEMGIKGAAAATLISRVAELFIILAYVLFIDKKLKMTLKDLTKFDFTYLKDFISTSSMLVLSGGMWGVAQAAQTAILGHMTAAAIAANSIAVIIYQIFTVVGSACANATSITIGKIVGEGRFNIIKPYCKTLQAIFVIIGIISAVLIFTTKGFIIDFYRISNEAKALSDQFLTILGIVSIGSCYQYPAAFGIVAGGGNTKYPAIIDNLFMWLFTIPFAALSAFVFNFPPVATFCFLKADQVLKCIPNAIKVNRYKWIKVLTR